MTTAPQAIAGALRRSGLATQGAQSSALGISREHWNAYVNGRNTPNLATVEAWLGRLDQAGHTLHLTLDPHIGWVCKEAT